MRRYEPRVYGFKVHAAAALARWQDAARDDLHVRLDEFGIPFKFIEESESEDEGFEYGEENSEGTKVDQVAGDEASSRMDLGN